MLYVYSDGGRKEAGYKGTTDDCTCRAFAIATGLPYKEVYATLARIGKKEHITKKKRSRSHPRTGIYKYTERKFMESLGWTWVPTMKIGTGCQVHLTEGELPPGSLVVALSKHMTAVIDDTVYDTHDPRRDGTRCVYGYYHKEAT